MNILFSHIKSRSCLLGLHEVNNLALRSEASQRSDTVSERSRWRVFRKGRRLGVLRHQGIMFSNGMILLDTICLEGRLVTTECQILSLTKGLRLFGGLQA